MTPRSLRVVIAPDSFKGTADADLLARAIATGWQRSRPQDVLTLLPQADGGEGTLTAMASTQPGSRRHRATGVCGPDRRELTATWLELPGRIGVVELAESSGLPLMAVPDPVYATSRGLGQVIRAAIDAGMCRLIVGLGGSASTDGGAGMLTELGMRFLGADGRRLDITDARALTNLAEIDDTDLIGPPAGGVEVLTDTLVPLCGFRGAAHAFGAQKGADPATRADLDRALGRLADVVHVARWIPRSRPGDGAAGGVGFGLRAWGAVPVAGAERIIELTGLAAAISTADLVITGEGRFDATSSTGKLVGTVLGRCADAGVRTLVIAGQIDGSPGGLHVSLSEVAGSVAAACSEPLIYAERAARDVAAGLAEAIRIPRASLRTSTTQGDHR